MAEIAGYGGLLNREVHDLKAEFLEKGSSPSPCRTIQFSRQSE